MIACNRRRRSPEFRILTTLGLALVMHLEIPEGETWRMWCGITVSAAHLMLVSLQGLPNLVMSRNNDATNSALQVTFDCRILPAPAKRIRLQVAQWMRAMTAIQVFLRNLRSFRGSGFGVLQEHPLHKSQCYRKRASLEQFASPRLSE